MAAVVCSQREEIATALDLPSFPYEMGPSYLSLCSGRYTDDDDDDALGTERHGPAGGTKDVKNRILSPAYEAPMYDYLADSEREGKGASRKKKRAGKRRGGVGNAFSCPRPSKPPLSLPPLFPCSQSRPAFQQEKIFTDIFVLLFPAAMEVVHPEEEGMPRNPPYFFPRYYLKEKFFALPEKDNRRFPLNWSLTTRQLEMKKVQCVLSASVLHFFAFWDEISKG